MKEDRIIGEYEPTMWVHPSVGGRSYAGNKNTKKNDNDKK
jgi:hypothetical protein